MSGLRRSAAVFNRFAAVQNGKAPPRFVRMALFRFARGKGAQRQRAGFARENDGFPGACAQHEGTKANDADD
jgi:hypothetical protein